MFTSENDESTVVDDLSESTNENTSDVVFIDADGKKLTVNTDDDLSIERIPPINTHENMKDTLLA